ncbi:hypothetical protein TIFTF001_052865 [Ficus carica]|uniref:Uncharacterized protein n=1 Tax=Ficus carica TaxID=3494 RepID=A0AA88JHQ8_FICCA|nr:hypothetical protein TIFTF001_052865 [Ficus carica]
MKFCPSPCGGWQSAVAIVAASPLSLSLCLRKDESEPPPGLNKFCLL